MVLVAQGITQLYVQTKERFIHGVLEQVCSLLPEQKRIYSNNIIIKGGRLGHGDETHRLIPESISTLPKIIFVACSVSHSAFVTQDGRITTLLCDC